MWLRIAALLASLVGIVAWAAAFTVLVDSLSTSPSAWTVAALLAALVGLLAPALPVLFAFSGRFFAVGKAPYVVVTEWLVEHPRSFWLGYTSYVVLLLIVAATLG